MSIPRKRTIICAHCGAEIDSWAWYNINLEKHPEAATKLRNGDYFKAFCRYCGKETIDPYTMICYDQRRGVFIEYWISKDSARNFYFDELLLDGQRCCVVYSVEDLAEKVIALQNGRDDRIVEMCKFWALIKYAKHLNTFELKRLYYSIENNKEKLIGIDIHGNKVISGFPFSVYQYFENTFHNALADETDNRHSYDTEWADSFIRKHAGLLSS